MLWKLAYKIIRFVSFQIPISNQMYALIRKEIPISFDYAVYEAVHDI